MRTSFDSRNITDICISTMYENIRYKRSRMEDPSKIVNQGNIWYSFFVKTYHMSLFSPLFTEVHRVNYYNIY